MFDLGGIREERLLERCSQDRDATIAQVTLQRLYRRNEIIFMNTGSYHDLPQFYDGHPMM